MENEKITPNSKYDWEPDNVDPKSYPTAAWENPSGSFFQLDPIGINTPPTPAETALTTEKSGKTKKSKK